jgi:hypothetical protein
MRANCHGHFAMGPYPAKLTAERSLLSHRAAVLPRLTRYRPVEEKPPVGLLMAKERMPRDWSSAATKDFGDVFDDLLVFPSHPSAKLITDKYSMLCTS